MADTVDQLPDTLSIPLRKPIEHAGLSYSVLELSEPTAGQLEEWDKLAGVAADIKAVSIMTSIPEVLVRQIPAREFNKAARFIGSFLA